MPFTFAHPAIILPFAKASPKYFSITAAVIGSMTPDFEYFFRLKVYSLYSHTWAGLFYFDLPMGIAVYILFHAIVRAQLLAHLPKSLYIRFNEFNKTDVSIWRGARWPVVALSILLGSASHLFWDGFTHRQGYFAEQLPFLRQELVLAGNSIPVCRILQHVSTVVGLSALGLAVYYLPKGSSSRSEPGKAYWSIIAVVAAIVLLGKFLIASGITFGDFVVSVVSGLLLGVLVASMYTRSISLSPKKSGR